MTEEGNHEEGGGVAIGGLCICLAMEGDCLVGPYASCDYEVGKVAAVEDSGQQI